mgnify:FL=1
MKRPDLGAWRKAHARNPIIVRPLRFLRAKLEIGRTEKGEPIMHPDWRVAQAMAKRGDGRTLQLLAQRGVGVRL